MNLNGKEYNLVWEEDFSKQQELNRENWTAEIWDKGRVNNEEQYYEDNPENIYIEDGKLKLKAVKKSDGRWVSGRITTRNKKFWKYGYFEAKVKLPSGTGPWPAFWMMPDKNAYGFWPKSGELDIMEYSPATFGNKAFSTLHYGTGRTIFTHHMYSAAKIPFENIWEQFHTFGVLWTEDKMEFYYDGKKVGRPFIKKSDKKSKWPFDQDFHIILNLAMGGILGGKIDEGMTEAVYEIEYVRVYQ